MTGVDIIVYNGFVARSWRTRRMKIVGFTVNWQTKLLYATFSTVATGQR